MDYYLCDTCGHLNGGYIETREFVDSIYSEGDYATVYHEEEREKFSIRLENIYVPKAKFLIDSLATEKLTVEDIKLLDIGAGSGYFVGALDKLGCSAKGAEVSRDQVEFGNSMLGKNVISYAEGNEIFDIIEKNDSSVISMIGVLEHLIDIHTMLKAIVSNKNIKYLFFSVPLFSLTCLFEAINPHIFNRHLGGAHTHLFTKSSLDWLYNKYDMKPIAVWDFGSDIMDIYRSLVISLTNSNASEKLTLLAECFFNENSDRLQFCVDESGFASETMYC